VVGSETELGPAPKTTALIVTFVVAVASNGRSQSDNLHFSIDRPGISDFPTITPKGHLQLEMGHDNILSKILN
jgi:hypothetical protein